MKILERERAALEKHIPGLDDALADRPVLELEEPGNAGLGLFQRAGGPGLIVPEELGGAGAGPLDAARVQRAIAARSPSLAVASTMHHFSLASLVELSAYSAGFEWMLLAGVAKEGRLVASGFAEGRPGQSILAPTMQAREVEGGFRLSGRKKPCSLSASMDLLTASVALPARSGEGTELAVAMIPAQEEGVERRPFWNSLVLRGAESDEVILNDVHVPDELVIRTEGSGEDLDDLQVKGFLWFELLITASYLGIASALAEGAIGNASADQSPRASLGIELEGAACALEGVARAMEAGDCGEDALASMLFARYSVQSAISRAVTTAVELLGGMSFIGSPTVAYLAAASRAIAFHPPTRGSMQGPLVELLEGKGLRMA